MSKFDYIIAGAGCAGLSLLMRLIGSGAATGKKILLVDRDAKKSNDRTWCFWEKEAGYFENIVYRSWQNLSFHAAGFSKNLEIEPYRYKLIRGIDFYNHCFDILRRHPNIEFLQEEISSVFSNERETGICISGKKFFCDYLFTSILFKKPELRQEEYWMLQHFKGWVIRAREPVFHAASGTLMDFRTDQKEGTTFFYVLPFSETEALVEYTLFSEKLLPQAAYEAALRMYMETTLQVQDYQVCGEEFGVIPMSNHRFPSVNNRMVYLGTAGGQTKASSGYTFRFIQKQSEAITESLRKNGHPFMMPHHPRRFHFYDSVLLHILQKRKLPGAAIFRQLFEKNKAAQVLRFLDNETTLAEDLRIISTLPFFPFLKAGLAEWKTLAPAPFRF